jgi:N-acetylmuramoyl-L-alanine amidase
MTYRYPRSRRLAGGVLSLALAFFATTLPPKLQAQPLGGPIVRSLADEARAPGDASSSQATSQDTSKSTRLAQSAASGDKDADSASEALGPPPIPLEVIRRLKVAGQSVPDGPTRVGNLDILAPLVPYMERLGARVTRAATANLPGNPNTPSQDQFFQINLPGDAPPIVLAIGSATAYINGNEQPLRTAPLVIRGQIWLPVFSLAPLVGAATRIASDGTLHINPTVQSVELFPVKGTLVLTVKTSAPLPADNPLMGTLEDPPKLYLDFPNFSMGFDATNSRAERVVTAGSGDVMRVRAGLFEDFPDTTRVVLDLRKPLRGVAQPLPDKTLFALVLTPPTESAAHVTAETVVNPVSDKLLSGITIVVDAGHGGHDTGARGAHSQEKDQALDIALRLASHLRGYGANVLLTRSDDTFISLQGRVDFANTRNADIFFSVHINSFQSNSTGTETYYYTSQSRTLAQEVHKELVKATGLRDRGIQTARFFVIRKTRMPSILTESAFISNPREEVKLMDPNWRERVAQGMTRGILNYAAKYMRPGTSG